MKDDNIISKVKSETERVMKNILKEGLNTTNLENLYKVVDIHKDLSNEEYWKSKEEGNEMMYRGYGRNDYDDMNYGNYGGGRRRDSQGRYMEGNSNSGRYGRRYRGHDYIDDMYDNYGTYMENRANGRYGSPETDKAFDYMVQSAVDFIDHIFEEIDSPEQAEKFKRELKRTLEKRM